MRTRIQAGAEIDLLTGNELDGILQKHFQRLRGVRYKHIPYSGAVPVWIAAPESGYVWSVKLLSAVFDRNDAPRVYTGDHEDSALVGVGRDSAHEHVLTWTGDQLIVFSTQPLIVNSFGSARHATGILMVEEVAVGDEWKL